MDDCYDKLVRAEEREAEALIKLELARRQRDCAVAALFEIREWFEATHGGELIEGVGWGDLLDMINATLDLLFGGTEAQRRHPSAHIIR